MLSYTVYREHKHDEVTVFVAEVPQGEEVVVDRAELAQARWWPIDALPGLLDDGDRGVLEALPGYR